MAIFGKGTLGVLGQIASLLNGTISSSLRLVSNLLFGGFKMVLQFNDAAMAFSRQAGLTAKQAQAYTEVLATRAKDLGAKYGIAAEEVAKLEQNLSRATGRVLMLSSAQADMQVALNRTAGEGAVNDFTQTIMRTMGGQVSTVQGAVSKAYATAAKKGLDAAGMAAKVGQNLSMANRLTFKNGVDGITKMVALSEKFGFNMQSLESAANSFMDIQDAIESSAKLSMLGGAAGAMGGNPLDMSYEANYDPEAFGERMTKILGGYAQFDEKTGMAKMNAMSRDFVKGIADAMHISLDEATAIAKKNAEVTYKNNKFGADLDRLSGGDANKRDFLLNKTQINNGQMEMYSAKTGKYENMVDYFEKGAGKDEFAEMMKFSGMSDEEIVREQAQAVLSINEKIQGWITTIQGIMAEKISPYLPKIQEFLGELYKMILPHIGEIAENVKNLIQTALQNMPAILEKVKYVVDAFGKFATFITSSWTKLLGAAFFLPIINVITNLFGGISKLFGKGKTATPARSKGGRPNKNYSWKQAKNYAKNAYRMSKGGVKGLWNGAKALWRNSGLVRGVAKGANVAGWLGLAADYGSDYLADKGVIEKGGTSHTVAKVAGQAAEYGALGASIGTFIGGPVGAAVGGALGAIGGGIAGYFDAQAQKEEAEKNKIAGSTPAQPAQPATPPEKHATGVASGAVGGKETPVTDKIRALLSESEMVFNEKDMVKAINRMEAKPVGGKEYIYIPQNTSTSTVGDNKITINDINVRVEGTIRLDAGNAQKDIDINKLLDNHAFVTMLAEKINNTINSNMNLKEMRDTAYLTGRGISSSTVGRMMTTT